MRMQATIKHTPNAFSEAAIAAGRQVWLAGLGAAAMSQDWIEAEAGNTFKTLVREGAVVESRTLRYIGDRLGPSVTRATALWRQTRATVQTTVRQAADSAVLFVRDTLPPLQSSVKPAATRADAGAKVKVAGKAARAPVAAKTRRAAAKRTATKRVAR